jgi:hypothetical protein
VSTEYSDHWPDSSRTLVEKTDLSSFNFFRSEKKAIDRRICSAISLGCLELVLLRSAVKILRRWEKYSSKGWPVLQLFYVSICFQNERFISKFTTVLYIFSYKNYLVHIFICWLREKLFFDRVNSMFWAQWTNTVVCSSESLTIAIFWSSCSIVKRSVKRVACGWEKKPCSTSLWWTRKFINVLTQSSIAVHVQNE